MGGRRELFLVLEDVPALVPSGLAAFLFLSWNLRNSVLRRGLNLQIIVAILTVSTCFLLTKFVRIYILLLVPLNHEEST